ncbi:MAG: hypothetical protein ACPG5P_00365 [Saprospiraceae bacterium]
MERRISVNFRGLHLLDKKESVNQKIPNMEIDPDGIAGMMNEGFSDFISFEDVIDIMGQEIMPNVFMDFNKKNELIHFEIHFISQIKNGLSIPLLINGINTSHIPEFKKLYQMPSHKYINDEQLYMRKIEIDTKTSDELIIIKYEVRFIP